MIETLAVIDAQNHPTKFWAGIVLHDNRVVEAAPIVQKMRGWTRDQVRDHCRAKGWKVSVVHEVTCDDAED